MSPATLMSPPAAPARRRRGYVTYEEYLDDPRYEENTEWVDGRVISGVSVTDPHCELVCWLIRVFGLLE